MSEQHEINRALEERNLALEARIAELERHAVAQDRGRLVRPRVSRMVAAAGLTLALLVPGVVLASHQFPDVTNSNIFHGDIDAIAEAGITAGFGDGGYHPTAAVTRQAMAAFMHRLGGRAAMTPTSVEPAITPNLSVAANSFSGAYVPVRQLTISVPGTNNSASPQQLVHLLGQVQVDSSMNISTQGCPCEFGARIRDTTTNAYSMARFQVFQSSATNGFWYSFDVEALFVAPAGPRTYELQAQLHDRNSDVNAATFNLTALSTLSATTFPFGPTGGNTP